MKTIAIISLLIIAIASIGCTEFKKETKDIIEFIKGDEAVKVNGVILKHQTTDSLAVAYEEEAFALSLNSADINLQAHKTKQAFLKVTYWEFAPGDAELSLDGVSIKLFSKSNNPTYISKVEGSLPEAIALSLASVSGNVSVLDFAGNKEIEVKSISGELSLQNTSAASLILETVSGDITADKLKIADGIYVNSTSGEISITASEAKKLSANTVSGDIIISSGSYDSTEANSTSGNIDIQSSKIASKQLSSVSGKITQSN